MAGRTDDVFMDGRGCFKTAASPKVGEGGTGLAVLAVSRRFYGRLPLIECAGPRLRRWDIERGCITGVKERRRTRRRKRKRRMTGKRRDEVANDCNVRRSETWNGWKEANNLTNAVRQPGNPGPDEALADAQRCKSLEAGGASRCKGGALSEAAGNAKQVQMQP